MTLPRVKASTNSWHSNDLVGGFQVLKEIGEYIYLFFWRNARSVYIFLSCNILNL